MGIGLIPAVGNWYQGIDQQKFEIVALDEDEGVVEIQYFGGELDEIDFENWSQMSLREISPPEDWTGPYDEVERDDLGYTDLNTRPEGHGISFEDFEEDE